MANLNPFTPNYSKTKTISVTSTTSNTTFDATDVSSSSAATGTSGSTVNRGTIGGHSVIRFFNAGTKIAFVRVGVGAQTALTTDMPLAPGVVEVFSKAFADDSVGAICGGSDTTTVYATCGEGQ